MVVTSIGVGGGVDPGAIEVGIPVTPGAAEVETEVEVGSVELSNGGIGFVKVDPTLAFYRWCHRTRGHSLLRPL